MAKVMLDITIHEVNLDHHGLDALAFMVRSRLDGFHNHRVRHEVGAGRPVNLECLFQVQALLGQEGIQPVVEVHVVAPFAVANGSRW